MTSRRNILRGIGAAGIAGLAGCAGGQGGNQSGSGDSGGDGGSGSDDGSSQGTTVGDTESSGSDTQRFAVSMKSMGQAGLYVQGQAAKWYTQDRDDVEITIGEHTHHLNFEVRGWRCHIRHGQDSQTQVDETARSQADWRGWRDKHKFDMAIRGHHHVPSLHWVLNRYPVVTLPSPKPGGKFADRIGDPDASAPADRTFFPRRNRPVWPTTTSLATPTTSTTTGTATAMPCSKSTPARA